MGGVSRSTRRLRRFAPTALLAFTAVVAALPAAAEPGAGPSAGPASYRLGLERAASGEQVFTASVERSVDGGRSWAPAAGEDITFAFVGEGSVVAIKGGAVNGMVCTTPASGACTVALDSDNPESSTLAAVSGDAAASASLGAG